MRMCRVCKELKRHHARGLCRPCYLRARRLGGLDAFALSHPARREHGTVKGYRQHARRGEPSCEPCRIAMRPLWKEADRRRNRRRVELEAPCGTTAAYRRHLRRGEYVDEACREAASREMRQYRRAKKSGHFGKAKCEVCGRRLALHSLSDDCFRRAA